MTMTTKIKSKWALIIPVLLIIIFIGVMCIMFCAYPNGDAIIEKMNDKDFETLSDISEDTIILDLFLPDGANRMITFIKTVNFSSETVTIYYFDDLKSLNAYYDGLDEPDEDEALYKRGKAVISGSKEAASDIRWIFWAF